MTDPYGPKPEFVVNSEGLTVAGAINAHLAHLRTTLVEPPDLAIATAYFNVGGYTLISSELDGVKRVRLLLGTEPDAVLSLDPPMNDLNR